MRLGGLAAPYDRRSRADAGGALVFAPGAFDASRVVVYVTVNHGASVIANQADKTLDLIDAEDGLYFVAEIGDPRWCDVLRSAMRNSRLLGCSVAWADAESEHGRIVYACLVHVSIQIGGYSKRPAFAETWAEEFAF